MGNFSLAPAQCLPICDPSSIHPRKHHLGWPCSSVTCPRSAGGGELCCSSPCLCPETFSQAGFAAGNSLISSTLPPPLACALLTPSGPPPCPLPPGGFMTSTPTILWLQTLWVTGFVGVPISRLVQGTTCRRSKSVDSEVPTYSQRLTCERSFKAFLISS